MRATSLALLGLLVACHGGKPDPPAAPAELRARLRRDICYGPCPAYTVAIYSDGQVRYHGEMYVKIVGDRVGHLSPAALAALDDAFASAGFMTMEARYGDRHYTDAAEVFILYVKDGVTKRVSDYQSGHGTPAAVTHLEEEIDRIAGTQVWVGAPRERVLGYP